MLLVDKDTADLDLNKVIVMSLLHDVGEIYCGDLIPSDNIPNEVKTETERASFRQVFSNLSKSERFLELWEEFIEGETPEARFVRQIDKLEMALQAKIYQLHSHLNMNEFIETAGEFIYEPGLVKILEDIKRINNGSST
jgi:putative hydrolase of HD superfamily